MEQLDLFDTTTQQEQIPNQEKPSFQEKFSGVQEGVKNKTTQLIDKSYNYIFHKGRIQSYKLEVKSGRIQKVLFHLGTYSFQVYLDYEYQSKNVRHFNYIETDPEERETIVKSIQIQNLKIQGVQKKVSVGYGELKQSANYFKHLGLDSYTLMIFLEELIKKFHTNT